MSGQNGEDTPVAVTQVRKARSPGGVAVALLATLLVGSFLATPRVLARSLPSSTSEERTVEAYYRTLNVPIIAEPVDRMRLLAHY